MNPIIIILLWIFSWFLIWAGHIFIFKKKENLRILYFFFVIFIIFYYFKDLILDFVYGNFLVPLIFLIAGIILDILLLRYRNGKNILRKHKHLPFFNLNYKYLLSKPLDILFQQLMIAILIFMLLYAGFGVYAVLITAIVFALVHFPLIVHFKGKTGILFVLMSFFGSAIFGTLITAFSSGLYYSYLLHYLFYTLIGYFYLNFYLKLKK